MPQPRPRRRNRSSAASASNITSARLAAPFITSPGGCSASEAEYPVSNRIEPTSLRDATFNLPCTSPDNSEESSDGWSDSEGLSSEDEEAFMEQNNSSQHDFESSMMNSAGDGLLLVSDDEKEVNDGDEYLSDSALNLNASKRMSTRSLDCNSSSEASPCSEPLEPSTSKIPMCVALGTLPLDDPDADCHNFGDPARNYDARYDGSLQDLMHGGENDLDSDDDQHRSGGGNESDSDDSSTEMAGYLSTASSNGGDMRDRFLKPYVGERPPTPPSPSQNQLSPTRPTPTRPVAESSPTRHMFQSPIKRSPPCMPIMDSNRSTVPYEYDGPRHESVDCYSHESSSPHQPVPSSMEHDVHHERTVAYGVEDHPRGPGDGHGGPALSGISLDDDKTLETLVSLNKAREKDRQLIRYLAIGLVCTVIMLALLAGGVVVMLVLNSSSSTPSTPTTMAPATPLTGSVSPTVAPAVVPLAVPSTTFGVISPTMAPQAALVVAVTPSSNVVATTTAPSWLRAATAVPTPPNGSAKIP